MEKKKSKELDNGSQDWAQQGSQREGNTFYGKESTQNLISTF